MDVIKYHPLNIFSATSSIKSLLCNWYFVFQVTEYKHCRIALNEDI